MSKSNFELKYKFKNEINNFKDFKKIIEENKINNFQEIKSKLKAFLIDHKYWLDFDTISEKILNKLINWNNILIVSDYDSDWFWWSMQLYILINFLINLLNSKSKIKIKFTNRLEWYWWQKIVDYLTEQKKDIFLNKNDLVIFEDLWINLNFNLKLINKFDIIVIDHHNPKTFLFQNFDEFNQLFIKEINKKGNEIKTIDELDNYLLNLNEKDVEKTLTSFFDKIKNRKKIKEIKEYYWNKIIFTDYIIHTKKNYYYWINDEKNKKLIKIDEWKDYKIKTSAWWTIFHLIDYLLSFYIKKTKIINDEKLKNNIQKLKLLKNLFTVISWITIISDKMPIKNLANFSISNLATEILWIFNTTIKKENLIDFKKVKQLKLIDKKNIVFKSLLWISKWANENKNIDFMFDFIFNLFYFYWKTIDFKTKITFTDIWFKIAPTINSYWRLFLLSLLFENIYYWNLNDILYSNELRKEITNELIEYLENWNNKIFDVKENWLMRVVNFKWLENYWKNYDLKIKQVINKINSSSNINYELQYKEAKDYDNINLTNLKKIYSKENVNIDWILSIISSRIMWQEWKNVVVWKYNLEKKIFHWSARFNINFFDNWFQFVNWIENAWWHNRAFWLKLNNVDLFLDWLLKKYEELWIEEVEDNENLLINISLFFNKTFIKEFLKYYEILIDVFDNIKIDFNFNTENMKNKSEIILDWFKNKKFQLFKLKIIDTKIQFLFWWNKYYKIFEENSNNNLIEFNKIKNLFKNIYNVNTISLKNDYDDYISITLW